MVERQDLNQFTSSTGETAVGVFIFLGLFFHAQSVPGVDVPVFCLFLINWCTLTKDKV